MLLSKATHRLRTIIWSIDRCFVLFCFCRNCTLQKRPSWSRSCVMPRTSSSSWSRTRWASLNHILMECPSEPLLMKYGHVFVLPPSAGVRDLEVPWLLLINFDPHALQDRDCGSWDCSEECGEHLKVSKAVKNQQLDLRPSIVYL